MCQLRGLLAGHGKFDPFHIALYYGAWIYYGPFDIGNTTAAGIGPLCPIMDNPDPKVAHEAAKAGQTASSMSNGSLMKITPLAVWTRNLSLQEMEHCVGVDVSMIHAKKAMSDMNRLPIRLWLAARPDGVDSSW